MPKPTVLQPTLKRLYCALSENMDAKGGTVWERVSEGMYVKVWDGIPKGYESTGILGHTGMGPESECVFSSKC